MNSRPINVSVYDTSLSNCDHSQYQRDCVACAARVVKLYLPATMTLSVEEHVDRYVACASSRDGFFRIVASGLTPYEALANLRNPLAFVSFMDGKEEISG